jgi:hypothetical protein
VELYVNTGFDIRYNTGLLFKEFQWMWVSRLMTFKRSSFFVKFLHLMFVKIYDVVYVACYEIFIKDDDDDDDGW